MNQRADSSNLVEASPERVDRREDERVTIEANVEITSFAKFLGRAVDLSVGGVYIETHEELEVDERVDLEMWVSEADEFLDFPGEIRWVEEDDTEGDRYGYGIEFVDISPEDEARLERIVGRCREA